jgi:outer membrane protein TolC
MMSWKNLLLGLALVSVVAAGCKQQIFLRECDYHEYEKLGLPPRAECTPGIDPDIPDTGVPTNVLDPERPAYYLTLAEAIALALEHGTTGIQSTRLFGTANDDLVTFAGAPPLVSGSDAIRVLALEPAITGTELEGSLAKFDALWRTSMNWTATDQPPLNVFQNQNGENAQFLTQLIKPLATGGSAGVAFNVNYQNLKQPPAGFNFLNPSYQTGLTFSFDQPLLQAFGVDINQLRATHPIAGTSLQNLQEGGTIATLGGVVNGAGVQGVLVTRLRLDQSRAEFERNVAFMLANVETAYWNLYGAYVTLYAREEAMKMSHQIWMITKRKYDAGARDADITRYAPTLGQYEQFRTDRLQALDIILERERTLRALLGLPPEDHRKLVPIDAPTLAPYQPNWHAALEEAMSLRPELVIAREDLRTRQLEVIREKNNLLPDLRFASSYNINGLGQELAGNDSMFGGVANPFGVPENALRSLASNHFNNWTLGLTLNVPIGFRAAYASVRNARLRLAEGYLQLRDQEEKASRFLAQQWRSVFDTYAQIQGRRAQRIAYGEEVRGELEKIAAGQKTPDLNTLDALRQWSTALDQEYTEVTAYNNALAAFQFAKGTILQHDNVVISDGPLPCCAQVRAVEHERQRSLALVKRERAAPDSLQCCGGGKDCPCVPNLPADKAPTIPSLLPDQNHAPEQTAPKRSREELPAPRQKQPGPQDQNANQVAVPVSRPVALPVVENRGPEFPATADEAPAGGPVWRNVSGPALPGATP